jgi:hypothetical protein
MTLESIVVSSDWQTIGVLGSVLGNLRIGIHVEPEPEGARHRLTRSKFDAVIVDCEIGGAADLLSGVRNNPSCRTSVPLAIASGPLGLPQLSELGARFVFEKPISIEQAVRTLSAARNLMLRGRLRYFRQEVEIPVKLSSPDKRLTDAVITNLSQGGIAVHVPEAVDPTEPVRLRFDLPDTDNFVEARGEITWTDERGNAGIRFVEISDRLQQNLEQWLASRYFAEVNA